MLLDPDEPDGYVRDWRPNLMPPEKHLAYAIQWFMITATVIIIYVTLSVRAAKRGFTLRVPEGLPGSPPAGECAAGFDLGERAEQGQVDYG